MKRPKKTEIFINLKLNEIQKQGFEHVFIPSSKLASLTQSELIKKAVYNPSVQKQKKEVEHLSKFVFKKWEKLTNQLERIHENPDFLQQLSINIAHDTHARLAGFKILGIKSPKRKEAQRNIVQFNEAVRKFLDCLEFSKKEVLQAHREEQYRVAQIVEQPTETIKHFLDMSSEARKNVLQIKGNPNLHRELSIFLNQVNSRLSADEHKMINSNDFRSFAKSIDVPTNKAKQIIEIIKQTKEMRNQIKLIKPPRQRLAITK
ncbi:MULTISPECIES: BID domain-containing T4SS effector [unclassified Bartonella]|uniref:BID domain-containing T4SS effector n=1 Tax=unclassified Bartonella TaxID=2645622 RepID=UPI00099961B9|nr:MULTISPECIES: BID domain-containing T4SS effector [unclassified Bartonella]AQX28285.1 Bartonella effector protein Bep10/2 [Bartonella sp. JB15]AQX29556.1 Bartonella effector protein Bep10/2 [Bartonella sp. JB63]